MSPTQKRFDQRGSDASAPVVRNDVEFVEVRVAAHYAREREADDLIVGNGGYPEATGSKTLLEIAGGSQDAREDLRKPELREASGG